MRKYSLLAPMLALALAAGCSQKNNAEEQPLLQAHFAGAGLALASGPGTKLKQIEALPATRELRQQVFEKLGRFAPQWLGFGAQTNLGAVIVPLVNDFWQHGGWIEVGGAEAKRYTRLAIPVPEARRADWQKSLDQLKAGAGGRLAWTQEGRWLLIVTGADAASRAAKFQQTVKASGIAALKPENWLEAQVNLPQLAPLLELPLQQDLPMMNLAFSNKGEEVRIAGTLDFAKPMSWRPEPWRIPVNLIKDPLVSFWAANGIAPWLEQTKPFGDLKLKTMPGQVYGWSQGGMPLLVYAAALVKDSTNLVSELAEKLPPVAFAQTGPKKVGDFFWRSNRAEIIWQGLPIMVPRVRAASEGGGQYVTAEVFPLANKGSNAPPELFAQVSGKNNLVYYDWEITESRVASWRQVFQLLPLFSGTRQVPIDFPAQKWLQSVAPQLGNTLTEVTYVSARQMNVVRRGHLGLTGYELTVLARAFDLWGMPPEFGKLQGPAELPAKGAAKP